MAAIAAPYGIRVISDSVGATPRLHRIPNGIQQGLLANIFKGQAIKLDPVQGTITTVTNVGGVPDGLWGVFDGVDYTPVGGRPVVSPFWPAGAQYSTTENMFVYFYPLWLPSTRLMIQADGAVPQTAFGMSFNLTNMAAGSTVTGRSAATVGFAGIAAGSQGQLTLVEFAPEMNDTVGDAFTDLICTVANPQIGFRGVVSTG